MSVRKIERKFALCAFSAILLLFSFAFLFPLSTAVYALPGEAGQILNFGSSGRDVSMGGAVSAVPQGANSVYWNPSLLGDVAKKDVAVLQAQLFSQTSLNWVGYAHPFKKKAGTIAFQIIQLKTQGGEKRDEYNELDGSFSHGEQVIGFGYGFHPTKSEKFALGIGFNMLQRTMGSAANTLYGLNIGSNYTFGQKLRTGIVLQNILRGKQGDTDDTLPITMRLGNSYQILNGFLITADIVTSEFRTPMVFNFGTEYSWRFISLRAGRPSDGDFSFGLGLSWKWIRLDIAMSSHKDLGSSQTISFGANFGKDRNVTRKTLAEQYLKEAQELIEKSEWLAAKAKMDRALKTDPLNAIIQLHASRLSEILKNLNFSSRKKTAQEEEKQFSGSGEPARLIKDGMKSFVEGSDSDAALLLRQALVHRREDKRLTQVVAYVEMKGKIKSDIDPNLNADEVITVKLKKVEDLFNAEHYQDALKVCMDLTKLAPEMAIPYVRLGSIYYAMGDVYKARKQYEKAIELNPNDETLKRFMKLQGWLQ